MSSTTGSSDKTVLDLYEHYRKKHPQFSASITPEPFNFSRSINRGLRAAKGEHYLILNNDVEIVDPGWLKEMVACLAYEGTGIVGAKLLYPNDKIQHAGVIVGFGGLAGLLVHEQTQGIRRSDEQATYPQLDDLRDRCGDANFRRLRRSNRDVR